MKGSWEARVELRKERKWKLSVVAIVIQILCPAWPPNREPLKDDPWPKVQSRSKVIKRVRGYGERAAGGARAGRCHARIVGRFRDVFSVCREGKGDANQQVRSWLAQLLLSEEDKVTDDNDDLTDQSHPECPFSQWVVISRPADVPQ